jgi:hypothetical protein
MKTIQTLVRLVPAAALFAAISAAPPAFAQGGYIGAYLVGDVVRLDQYDTRSGDSGNGEALGFALRLGGALASRWGVELEFVRPGEITSDETSQILPAVYSLEAIGGPISSLPNVPPDSIVFPPYSFRFQATQRRTTLSTSLWVRQPITRSFSLAYVGGIAFGRTTTEVEVSYVPVRPTILPIPPSVSEAITYDIGPMVGVEGRIRMGRQVDLVPGIRLHGHQGGWLIRPAIGLAWTF